MRKILRAEEVNACGWDVSVAPPSWSSFYYLCAGSDAIRPAQQLEAIPPAY